MDNEEQELESFKAKVIPNRKIRNEFRGKQSERLSVTTFSKDIKLEDSQLIISELVNTNPNRSAMLKNSYLEKSFVRSDVKKKSTLTQNFKEAKDRMQYDKKLTQYLHQKPNIHKILKKYTTEISPIITEIHLMENFNDKNMTEAVSNHDNIDFLKKKFKDSEKKLNKEKIKPKNEYFMIKRNDKRLLKSLHDKKEDQSYDSDNQSITEAALDNLYKESMNIQKRILEKKHDGVGKRLKQFIKLSNISEYVFFLKIF